MTFLNLDGGGEGLEIGEGSWRDGNLEVTRAFILEEECEAEAESIMAHSAASSRSLSSTTTGYVSGEDILGVLGF